MFKPKPRKPVILAFAFKQFYILKVIARDVFKQVYCLKDIARVTFKQICALKAILLITSISLTFVLTYLITATPLTAQAATDTTLNFQARLETASGSIVPDGDYNVEFKLYDASSSSGSSQGSCTGDPDCLWTETRTSTDKVHVVNGYLSVDLGSVNPFPAINWDQNLYLSMNIGGTGSPSWDGEMDPRLHLTGVPYAFQAASAEQLQTLLSTHTGTLQFATLGADETINLPDLTGGGTFSLLALQNTSTPVQQTGANFNIDGVGMLGTLDATGSGTGNTLTIGSTAVSSTGGAINIGTGASEVAGTISIGGANQTGAITLGQSTASNTITIGASAGSGNTQTINIGTSTTGGSTTNTTIGSTVSGGTTKLESGATSETLTNSGDTIGTTANSSTQFVIQNSNSNALFGVNSSNNILSLNSGVGAQLGNNSSANWSSTTALSTTRAALGVVESNGYIYIVGGASNQARYAKVDADGTLGSWTAASNLPAALFAQSTVIVNGYIYAIGGSAGGVYQNTTYYAHINQDGTLGTWQTSPQTLPASLRFMYGATANGYIYVAGGYDGSSAHNNVYYTKVSSSGAIGAWQTNGTNMTANSYNGSTLVANGYLYLIGGSSFLNDYNYAPINSNGSIGTFTHVSTGAVALNQYNIAFEADGNVYSAGGWNGTNCLANVFVAPLGNGGALGTFTAAGSSLPSGNCYSQGVVANGYAYILGGNGPLGNAAQTNSWYISLPRTQIAGSLDLLGLNGSNLADQGSGSAGSAAGTLTAGAGNFVGTLQVQGQASFNQGVNINGTLSVVSDVTFQNTTDSTTAFQIQNAAGTTTVLDADTTHDRVGIGNAAPNYPLDVTGDTNTSGVYRIGGATMLQEEGFGNDFIGGAGGSSISYSSACTVSLTQYACDNVGLGTGALNDLTNGDYNFALGANALYGNQAGSNNVAIGVSALSSLVPSSGGGNVAIGSNSGENLGGTTDSNNIVIGYNTGNNLTTDNANNIIIGANIAGPVSGASNYLDIGNVLYGDTQYGTASIQTTSATAFQIQTAGGAGTLLAADTSASILYAYGAIIDTNNPTATSSNGSLVLGCTGSSCWTNNINGTIGFYGNGVAHAEIAFSPGNGFYFCDTSADAPGGDYGQCATGANVTPREKIFVGGEEVKNTTNSTTALQVQNASGNEVFTVDTSSNSTQGQVVLGKVNTNNAALVFESYNSGSGGGSVTLKAPNITSANSYTLALPTSETDSECLQSGTTSGGVTPLVFGSCGATGSFLAKNATDTSSAAVGTGYLYGFTNSSSTSTGGVLSLDNGTNTGSALSATTSGNPAAGKAVIYAQNTNASPSGNLLDLEAGSSPSSVFSVNAAGDITNASNKINSDTLSGSTLTFGAASAASVQSAAGQALNITGNADSTWSVGSHALTLTSSNFNVSSVGAVTLQGGQTKDITTSGATALTIDTGGAAALNLGTASANAINIGNTTSNVATTINGTALVKPTGGHDSTTAFQVQNAAGYNELTVDTSGNKVTLGNITSTSGHAVAGVLVLADGATDNIGTTIETTGTASSSPTFQLSIAGATNSSPYQICSTLAVCSGYQASGNYLLQVPTTNSGVGSNDIQPATTGITGLTVNGTNTGTAATALVVNQSKGADGEDINATAGSVTAGLAITQSGAGSLTNGLTFAGTIGTDITRASGTLKINGGGGVTVSTSAGQNIALNPGSGANVTVGGAETIQFSSTASAGTINTATAAGAAGIFSITGQTAGSGNGGALTFTAGTAATGSTGGQINLLGGGTSSGGTDGGVRLDAGSGSSTTNGTILIGNVNASTISVGNANTSTLTLGQSTGTNEIDIGHATVATGNTQTIKIGDSATGTGVDAITIGSLNSTSTTLIQGGTGSNAISLTPNDLGAIVIGGSNGQGSITLGSSNNSSGQAVLIGAGGTVVGSGTTTVNIANAATLGVAINIAGGANTVADNVKILDGVTKANANVEILSGVGTAGTATLKLGNNPYVNLIDIGNVANQLTRTTTIAGGDTISGKSDIVNIATGDAAGSKIVHIADGNPTGSNTVTVGSTSTSSTTTIQGGTGGSINVGSIGSSNNASTIHVADTNGSGQELVTLGSSGSNTSNLLTLQNGSTSETFYNTGNNNIVIQGSAPDNGNMLLVQTTATPATGGALAAFFANTTSNVTAIDAVSLYGQASTTNVLSVQSKNGGSYTNMFTVGATGNVASTSTETTGTAVNIATNNVTSGKGLNLSANGLTTGYGANLSTTSNVQTAGSLLNLSNTATVGTNGGNVSANLLNVSRALTASITGGTLTPAVDNSATYLSNTPITTTWTNSFTVGSHVNKYLMVVVNEDNGHQPTSVTYNGTAMSYVGNAGPNSCVTCAYFYTLVAPAAGTHNIVVTASGSSLFNMIVDSWYNVNQSTPYAHFTADVNGSSGSPAITATSTSGNTVVDWATVSHCTAPTLTQAAGQTFINSQADNVNCISQGSSYKTAAGSTTAMSWTDGAVGNWGEIAVDLEGATTQSENVTNAVASLSNNCTTGTGGTCNDGSNVLSLNQQFSGATGTVLSIKNSGTGNGLEVQNSSGINIFSVDTTTDGGNDYGQIVIGTGSAGNATPVLLVLDTGLNSADPTEVNGAMYYNASMNSFRCGENSAWISCIGGLVSSKQSVVSADTVASTATQTVFTGTGDQYTIPANSCQPGVVYRITMAGTYGSLTSNNFQLWLNEDSTATVLATDNNKSPNQSGSTISNQGWYGQILITCDSTTAVEVEGEDTFSTGNNGTQTATDEPTYSYVFANTGTKTWSTSAHTLEMSAKWGTGSASNTITLRQFTVERLGP